MYDVGGVLSSDEIRPSSQLGGNVTELDECALDVALAMARNDT